LSRLLIMDDASKTKVTLSAIGMSCYLGLNSSYVTWLKYHILGTRRLDLCPAAGPESGIVAWRWAARERGCRRLFGSRAGVRYSMLAEGTLP
jgi:hypothetical protein